MLHTYINLTENIKIIRKAKKFKETFGKKHVVLIIGPACDDRGVRFY